MTGGPSIVDLPGPLLVAAVLLIATFAQSTMGFGFALVFTPLASLLVGPRDAVATAIVVSALLSLGNYLEHHPRAGLRGVAPLAIAGLAGMPLGLLLLVRADEQLIRLLVAGAVLVGALINIAHGTHAHPLRPATLPLTVGVGLASGLLRGATSLGGPPIVLYQHWRGGDAAAIRGRLFAYFLLFGIPGVPLAVASGVVTADVWRFAAAGVPAVLLGIVLARLTRPRLPDAWFALLSMALLAVTATAAAAGAAIALG